MPGDLTAVAPSVWAVLTVSGPSPADLTAKCELRLTQQLSQLIHQLYKVMQLRVFGSIWSDFARGKF